MSDDAARYQRVSDAVKKAMSIVGERGEICIGYELDLTHWRGHACHPTEEEIANWPNHKYGKQIQAYVPYVTGTEVYRVICKEYPHLRLRHPGGMLVRSNVFMGAEYPSVLVVEFWHPKIEEERLSNFWFVSTKSKKDVVDWFGGKLTEAELFD